ncbi:MAG: HEPN domain-containing protein [Candidatus Woesearchaeota archaeon]
MESFLHKLYRQKKIKIEEPSVEIKDAYLQKSSKSLLSAKAVWKIGNLEDAVAFAYYSMYHCLTALLFRIGIKCENHAASIILMKEVLGLDNKEISYAKSERVDKQYYVDFNITKEDVAEAIKVAEGFNSEIRAFIDKLDQTSVEKYRKKVKLLLEEDTMFAAYASEEVLAKDWLSKEDDKAWKNL